MSTLTWVWLEVKVLFFLLIILGIPVVAFSLMATDVIKWVERNFGRRK